MVSIITLWFCLLSGFTLGLATLLDAARPSIGAISTRCIRGYTSPEWQVSPPEIRSIESTLCFPAELRMEGTWNDMETVESAERSLHNLPLRLGVSRLDFYRYPSIGHDQ